MRVIAGIYRGRRLRAPAGLMVRPTSDRLRETLFNLLAPDVAGSRFLDVCAGSGAVGIEALSRGAAHVTFVEASRRACAVIEANLAQCGVRDEALLVCRDALATLKWLAAERARFDLVFFDPPYKSELYPQVMRALAEGNLFAASGIVIVEHRAKTPPEKQYGRLRVYREVRQGESALALYRLDDTGAPT